MIEPKKVGHFLKIGSVYYKIIHVERITEVTKDISVPAGGETDYIAVDELYVPEDTLGQFFVGVDGNVEVYVKVGVKDRFGLERALGKVTDRNSPPGNELDINLYVVYNLPPRFKVKNLENSDITATLKFTGYTYKLERYSGVPEVYTEIPISPP
jgi:hypothetical protein